MSHCFNHYLDAATASNSVGDDFDAVTDLIGCVRGVIIGSGPLYHPVTKMTNAEEEKAKALAEKTRTLSKKSPSFSEVAVLMDEIHSFAMGCLVDRGAVHKGPPKI